MKKLSLVVVLLTMAITTFAQEKDVTKFLGIPVDGTKTEMIAKLKEKGYTLTSWDKDILEGEFNGTDVYVSVVTNNNKVYRIYVVDKNSKDEASIKTRFNILCQQFMNNSKYTYSKDYSIPEDEDISYEMLVNNKQYQAAFFQLPEKTGPKTSELADMFMELLQDSTATKEVKEAKRQEIIEKALEASNEFNKLVWFMISENYGKYYIAIFYDNVLNQANGDDL